MPYSTRLVLLRQSFDCYTEAMLRAIAAFFVDIIETVIIAIAIFVAVYLFLLQPHQVIGESMEPSFESYQYILTDKISYRLHDPERGDVVIFKAPQGQGKDLIKRIVGLPGEKIRLSGGKIIIFNAKYPQGLTLNETYTNGGPTLPEGAIKENGDYAIAADKFFTMGDNRSHSSDSREFGAIDKSLIIGRAWIRYWPLPAVSFIPQVQY